MKDIIEESKKVKKKYTLCAEGIIDGDNVLIEEHWIPSGSFGFYGFRINGESTYDVYFDTWFFAKRYMKKLAKKYGLKLYCREEYL